MALAAFVVLMTTLLQIKIESLTEKGLRQGH